MFFKILIMAFKGNNKVDSYIAFAIASSPILSLIQLLLIHVFQYPEEESTKIRVLLVVVTMLPAIIICFLRRPKLFLCTYIVIIFIMGLTAFIFPENSQYVVEEGLRFFLPTVVPSALCLLCLPSIDVFERMMLKLSWVAFFLLLYFTYSLINGKVLFFTYDMSLSYSALIPAAVLYSQKKVLPYIASFFIFIFIFSLGARGPAVVFLVFIFYDLLANNRKAIIPILIIVFFFISFISLFSDYLESLGFTSRTLKMLLDGEITQDSGRGNLRSLIYKKLNNSPLWGLGLWGDRPIIGAYCHNFFLEMCVDFGYLFGPIIILLFICWLLLLYFKSSKESKKIMMKYVCTIFLPLQLSSSYLSSYSFGMLIGVLLLIHRESFKSKVL